MSTAKQLPVTLPLCSNGERLADAIASVHSVLLTHPETSKDDTGRSFFALSLTTIVNDCGYSETDRIVISSLMQRLGLVLINSRKQRKVLYFLASEAWRREVLIEANLLQMYTEYKEYKAIRSELHTLKRKVSINSETASAALSTLLVDEVAGLIIERDDAQDAVSKAEQKNTELQAQVADLMSQTKFSAEDALANAIAKLRKKS